MAFSNMFIQIETVFESNHLCNLKDSPSEKGENCFCTHHQDSIFLFSLDFLAGTTPNRYVFITYVCFIRKMQRAFTVFFNTDLGRCYLLLFYLQACFDNAIKLCPSKKLLSFA